MPPLTGDFTVSFPCHAHQATPSELIIKKIESRHCIFTPSCVLIHLFLLPLFYNFFSLAVQYQKDPLAQKNTFTAPNSENIDTLKRFSEFLLWISDSLCVPLVMKYSERAIRPGIMEVFISALSILFNAFLMFLVNVFFLIDQEISELLWKTLPLLNFSALESLRLLSETPDPLYLNETLRNQQYSLLFLFYLAFSYEDRIVPEADLFSAISSFLLSVEDQGDCPPPYIVKAILYLLAICQHKSKALDLVNAGLIIIYWLNHNQEQL
uniref:Uncharacterized protein n=1 Tax=Laticauda laticaudata TaxID=8630 RepID=A0A8C5RHW3_LATLA